MNIEDIQIGDMVRIRDWDDMKAEFGEENGNILCTYGFCDYMKPLCGMTLKVRDIRGGDIDVVDEEGYTPAQILSKYCALISADMLEPEIELNPFSHSEINVLLGI